jgi:ribose transport system permease protein
MNTTQLKSGKFNYRKIFEIPEMSVILPFAVLCIIVTIINPVFLSPGNLLGITKLMTIFGFLALGETFIITTGEIDISIGSMTAFASVFCSWLMAYQAVDWPLAIIFTFMLTMGLSLINSLFIVKMKMHSFIITIAMLYVCKGGARVLLSANSVVIVNVPEAQGLIEIFSKKFNGIGIGFIVLVVFYVIAHIVLNRTPYGRKVQATGDSLAAARLSGINTDRIKISTYLISGFMVTVTSVFMIADIGGANPNTGDGWEMFVIAGCAIGAVSMTGGYGSFIGIFFGVAFMTSMQNIFALFNINPNWQNVILGAVIVVAVIMDVVRRRRKFGISI